MSRDHKGVRFIGVTNKNSFVTLMGLTKQFEAQWIKFLEDFDGFVALSSRSDAEISRHGDFCADKQTDGQNRLLYPLLCMHT